LGVGARNPAFDITPWKLVSALVTERGILYPPFLEKLRELKRGTELEFVIMVIAVSCVKLLSAHNSTQHTSRKHKV
jgi:Predicted translation initiation factor 2B subunit, eIF-2B alpha/beta/delta family